MWSQDRSGVDVAARIPAEKETVSNDWCGVDEMVHKDAYGLDTSALPCDVRRVRRSGVTSTIGEDAWFHEMRPKRKKTESQT